MVINDLLFLGLSENEKDERSDFFFFSSEVRSDF